MLYVIILYGDFMYSIKNRITKEIEEKKSRFIGVATSISSEESAKEVLSELRKEYPNATHYTYALILGDTGIIQKASDDGEPTRTAGYPILEVLLKNDMTNVILVVIRYFGGVKLGAGGLIRAYSKTAAETLSICQRTKKNITYLCQVKTDYDHIGNVDKYLRENTNLIDVEYDQNILFTFKIESTRLEFTREELFQKNNFEDSLEIIEEFSEYS